LRSACPAPICESHLSELTQCSLRLALLLLLPPACAFLLPGSLLLSACVSACPACAFACSSCLRFFSSCLLFVLLYFCSVVTPPHDVIFLQCAHAQSSNLRRPWLHHLEHPNRRNNCSTHSDHLFLGSLAHSAHYHSANMLCRRVRSDARADSDNSWPRDTMSGEGSNPCAPRGRKRHAPARGLSPWRRATPGIAILVFASRGAAGLVKRASALANRNFVTKSLTTQAAFLNSCSPVAASSRCGSACKCSSPSSSVLSYSPTVLHFHVAGLGAGLG